jgi:hypothetical protein
MPAPYILHTMSLVSALDVGNWHRLFPNLGIFMVVKNIINRMYEKVKRIKWA